MAVILPIFLYTRVRSMAVLSYPDALQRSFSSANEAIRANVNASRYFTCIRLLCTPQYCEFGKARLRHGVPTLVTAWQ